MSARQRALAYLAHPFVVVSIVLLVLNDAAWKGAGPPWLTGKLSDFAGLVFFPGLLALGIGLVVPRAGARAVGLTSWWSSAVFFAAVKTVPAANAAYIDAIAVVRGPVQVVLDPTDVLALAVMPIGWCLWNRLAAPTTRKTLRASAGWTVASCALLATGATQCWPPAAVQRVLVDGPTLYASVRSNKAVSTDLGRTWTKLDFDDVRHARVTELSGAPADPVTQACHPMQPDVCYRIVDSTNIAASRDGGSSWQVTWTTSSEEIARRRKAACGVGGGAQSLVFAESNTPVVLVAMASEGVLRQELDGDWQRVSVLDARLWSGENTWQKMDGIEQLSLLVVVGTVLVPGAALVAMIVRRRRRARRQTYWLPFGAAGPVLVDPNVPYAPPGWPPAQPRPGRRWR